MVAQAWLEERVRDVVAQVWLESLCRTWLLESSVITARLYPGSGTAAVLFGNGRAAVSHPLTMNRVMPPRSLAAATSRYVIHIPVPVYVIVDLHVPLNVDDDVMTMPIKASPRIAPGNSNPDPEAKADDTASYDHSPRMIKIRTVCRPPPGTVNNHGIINRHVYDLRGHGLYDDLLGFRVHHDVLLVCRHKISLLPGAQPELLNRCHDLFFLTKKGISQLLRPVQPVTHHLQNWREIYERFHTRVPVLLFQCNGELITI